MVSIPIAISIKNVENPVTRTRRSFSAVRAGQTSLSEHLFVKNGSPSPESDQRPQGRRKSGAENPHIKRKYKDIVTGNVKIPPARTPAVASPGFRRFSKSRKHLVKKKQRYGKFDREQVSPGEWKQRLLRPEQRQELTVKS